MVGSPLGFQEESKHHEHSINRKMVMASQQTMIIYFLSTDVPLISSPLGIELSNESCKLITSLNSNP